MKTITSFRPAVTLLLGLALFAGPRAAWALPCDAAPAAPAPVSPDAGDRAAGRLVAAGLTPAQAEARVAAMAPEEIAHVADAAPEIRSGGDGLVTVLVVVAIVAIVYMVVDYHHRHHD